MSILVVDDFFSEAALHAIEVGDYKVESKSDERNIGITSRRKMEIACQPVDDELIDYILSEGVREAVKGWADLAWRYVYNAYISNHETAISVYEPKVGFDWHTDHADSQRRRVLNWMLTYAGSGTLEWTTDPLLNSEQHEYRPTFVHSADMKPNRLFVMPAYYPHRIVLGDETRTALHGHFLI